LAYKGGAKTLSKGLYNYVDDMIKKEIHGIVRRAVIFAPRKVIKSSDVKEVMRFMGRTVYATDEEEKMKKCMIFTKTSDDGTSQSIKKINHYQNQHDCVYISRSKFARIVKMSSGENKKWSRKALSLLQCIVEDHIVKNINYGVISMIHRGKKTLMSKDIEMVRKLHVNGAQASC
jgi:histone H3/H4